MLQKLEISAGLMGRLAHMQTLPKRGKWLIMDTYLYLVPLLEHRPPTWVLQSSLSWTPLADSKSALISNVCFQVPSPCFCWPSALPLSLGVPAFEECFPIKRDEPRRIVLTILGLMRAENGGFVSPFRAQISTKSMHHICIQPYLFSCITH